MILIYQNKFSKTPAISTKATNIKFAYPRPGEVLFSSFPASPGRRYFSPVTYTENQGRMSKYPRVDGMAFLEEDIDQIYNTIVNNRKLQLLTYQSQTYVLMGVIIKLSEHPLVADTINSQRETTNDSSNPRNKRNQY